MSENKKSHYVIQRMTKEDNQRKVLSALMEHPKRFVELLRETGLSKMTLSKYLHDFEDENKVELVLYKRRAAYQIIGRGIAEIQIRDMIEHLGLTAVHYIVKKNLNLSTEDCDILNLIKSYLSLKLEGVTWKELEEYLEKMW